VVGEALRRAGINPEQVKRKRATGEYIADFYVPGMGEPVHGKKYWQRKIAALPGVEIVKTDEIRATWRPGKPIISASVMFNLTVRVDELDELWWQHAIPADAVVINHQPLQPKQCFSIIPVKPVTHNINYKLTLQQRYEMRRTARQPQSTQNIIHLPPPPVIGLLPAQVTA
jgi:hypothetical protein